MVIYLEEAVARKRAKLGGTLTAAALREAVTEGALLRLRPKVMTVSTVVAGLLPIMWSTDAGAEVMKPLATPVLGGMVSSLLHVLVVTPVVFSWLHERRLGLRDTAAESPPPRAGDGKGSRRPLVVAALAAAAIVAVAGLWLTRESRPDSPAGEVVQRVRSGEVEIVLLSEDGVLRQGRNRFVIEFRRSGTDALVDVGRVSAGATMPMPGMVMSSGLALEPTGTPGRFRATAEFGMAGAWQMALDWDGPAGRGSARFEGGVQ
jgi:Cu(I)/Ag(I) efflux system membrane protein CusA/SilA